MSKVTWMHQWLEQSMGIPTPLFFECWLCRLLNVNSQEMTKEMIKKKKKTCEDDLFSHFTVKLGCSGTYSEMAEYGYSLYVFIFQLNHNCGCPV